MVTSKKRPKKITKSDIRRQIFEQREKIRKAISLVKKEKISSAKSEYITTGIAGFDALIEKGIPKKQFCSCGRRSRNRKKPFSAFKHCSIRLKKEKNAYT